MAPSHLLARLAALTPATPEGSTPGSLPSPAYIVTPLESLTFFCVGILKLFAFLCLAVLGFAVLITGFWAAAEGWRGAKECWVEGRTWLKERRRRDGSGSASLVGEDAEGWKVGRETRMGVGMDL